MTRPIQVPSPTRRISESMAAIRQLQRRPAPEAESASGSVIWATAFASSAAITLVTNTHYPFTFNLLHSNDSAAFEAADVTAGRADYIQINTSGYYVMKAQIFKSIGVFPSTNDTWIEPAVDLSGTRGGIQSNLGVADFFGAYFSAGAAIKSGGEGHEGLFTTLAFNWDPDNPVTDIDSQNPLKVGLNLAEAGGPASITMSGSIFLMRIAAPGYVDLSP